MIYRLNTKPISVNEAFRGRRFKSDLYEDYEEELFQLLPALPTIKPEEKLRLSLRIGLSNNRSDIDNPVKPFLDVLQKAYEFDDRQVYRLEVDKVYVPKGQEYIEFELSPLSTP